MKHPFKNINTVQAAQILTILENEAALPLRLLD